MSYFSKRALRWAAPVALVGALGLAACGSGDSTEAVRVAAPSVGGAGSDQHLNNKAVELAQEERAYRAATASFGSDQHLNNKAAEIASQRANRAASDRLTGQAEQIQRAEAARVAAQAERFERSAHLEGQANTYSGIEVGNRAAQMAQAEQYVQQLQDRAESNSSGNDSDDDFLPGSHHLR
jgi:hypothetical protein